MESKAPRSFDLQSEAGASAAGEPRKGLIPALRSGLSAAVLKWIALAAMTLGHINNYVLSPDNRLQGVPLLDVLGELSAPLFLFLVMESLKHVSHRMRYCLRLLVAGLLGNCIVLLLNLLVRGSAITIVNVLFAYFYAVAIVLTIESIRAFCRGARKRELLWAPLLLIGFEAIGLVCRSLEEFPAPFEMLSYALQHTFPTIRTTEFLLAFVLLGVVWYYCRSRKAQCIALAGYFLLCELCFQAGFYLSLPPHIPLVDDPKPGVLLVLPLILLYNGQRGRQPKWLFYAYYPLHKWLLSTIQYLFLQ